MIMNIQLNGPRSGVYDGLIVADMLIGGDDCVKVIIQNWSRSWHKLWSSQLTLWHQQRRFRYGRKAKLRRSYHSVAGIEVNVIWGSWERESERAIVGFVGFVGFVATRQLFLSFSLSFILSFFLSFCFFFPYSVGVSTWNGDTWLVWPRPLPSSRFSLSLSLSLIFFFFSFFFFCFWFFFATRPTTRTLQHSLRHWKKERNTHTHTHTHTHKKKTEKREREREIERHGWIAAGNWHSFSTGQKPVQLRPSNPLNTNSHWWSHYTDHVDGNHDWINYELIQCWMSH